jgi:surfactin synthase thioesterase subunit
MVTHHRDAEINLPDGGHFLLESRLAEVAALIRPFLQEHLDRVAERAFAG